MTTSRLQKLVRQLFVVGFATATAAHAQVTFRDAQTTVPASGLAAPTGVAVGGAGDVNGTAYAVSGVLFPVKTPDGTYLITFTGVSGSLANSTTVKFTVK